jgi:hypothetical protein
MGLNEIVAALDYEISRLEQMRSLLAGTKGNVTLAATSFAFGANQGKTRKPPHLSAEARARIAAAQMKRWTKQIRAAKKEAVS